MEKQNSWTSIIKPDEVINDLIVFAEQWNSLVEIKINNPFLITQGPILIKISETH